MNGSPPPLRAPSLDAFGARRHRRRAARARRLEGRRRMFPWRGLALTIILGQFFAWPTSITAQVSPSAIGVADPQMARDVLPSLVAPPSPGPTSPGPPPPGPAGAPRTTPLVTGAGDSPVTFTADEVEYDRERERVVARGRVEAWQDGRFLRADTFTYDRNTRIALVQGNVQIIEADGQIFYAQEAELGEGFRDGVLTEVRARLAQNARLVGNGARRTDGTVNEISRPVYSSCNLCESDPTRPPLWQMRARMATQDRDSQRISYRDATLQMGGIPLFYSPYLSHPDPQTPRASGFLFPTTGYTRFLGAFAQPAYFWAIDDQQDLTVTPTFGTLVNPNLGLEYRRRFNSGELYMQGSIGYQTAEQARRAARGGVGSSSLTNSGLNISGLGGRTIDDPGSPGLNGHFYSRGRFTLDQNWRFGFDLNRASSESYLRTYKFEYRRVLASTIFVEGFWGTETYARLDSRAYQGLRSTDNLRTIPYVAPNGILEHAPSKQIGGGWLTTDVTILGLTRPTGTFSQRLATRASWERPMYGSFGDVWTLRGQADGSGYYAGDQQLNVFNPLPAANGIHANANIRAALDWRMPFVRTAGDWGTQLIEPRVQFVTGPRQGRQIRFPNEDALDLEFTDANLFDLSRYPGRDRMEGTTRVDAALRSSWNFPNGGRLEGIVGRSIRATESSPFVVGTGLDRRASDWVGRATFSPVSWIDILGRARLDSQSGALRATDAVATVNFGRFGPIQNVYVNAGYLYNRPLPQFIADQGRNEVVVGGGAQWRTAAGGVWRVQASVRYDVRLDRPSIVAGNFGYEDECFIIEGRVLRRYAQDITTRQNFSGGTVMLVRVGFKTVGDYFFRAI